MNKLVVTVIVCCMSIVGRFYGFAQEFDTIGGEIITERIIDDRLSTQGYENLIGRRVEKLDYDLKAGQGRNLFMYNDFGLKKKNKDLNLNLRNGIGPVAKWQGGMTTVDCGSVDYPGMMGAEFAGVNVYQNAGRFTFGAHGDVMRYGYFRGVSNQFGIGGSIGYRILENVSVIVFGSVYSQVRGRGISPAMIGFMPSSGYGGMVDFTFGNAGIMTGLRHEYVPAHGRWEVWPILAPYWGSGSRRFSIDIGSIIGNLLLQENGKRISDYNSSSQKSRSLPSVGRPGYIPPHRR